MKKVLKQGFFERPTLTAAKGLLGKYLVRKYRDRTIAAMITEVEAYDGPKDRASHASRGLTPRTKIMFGPAGNWYVYFTYGMHWLANIVTGKEGYPAAILIRGVAGTNGPARVTKTFHIDKKLNGKPANKKSGLWLENRGVRIKGSRIKKAPRIGVGYAGPVWANKRFRFFIDEAEHPAP